MVSAGVFLISDADLAAVALTGHDFHPEWNYTIKPHLLTDEP